MCKDIYVKNGELTIEDYKNVCRTFDYRENVDTLYYEVRNLWEEYKDIALPKPKAEEKHDTQ
jgi:hypothetical protein